MKRIITGVNFFLLSLIVVNLLAFLIFKISLNATAIWIVKIAFYISGIIGFFFYMKPYTKISLYFTYFVASPILTFLAWLLDGIFGAIIISVFFFWLFPNMKVYSNEELIVYKPMGGFLGSCCNYEVYEKIAFLEKRIGAFQYESFDEFSSNDYKFIQKNNEVYIYKKDSLLEHVSIK